MSNLRNTHVALSILGGTGHFVKVLATLTNPINTSSSKSWELGLWTWPPMKCNVGIINVHCQQKAPCMWLNIIFVSVLCRKWNPENESRSVFYPPLYTWLYAQEGELHIFSILDDMVCIPLVPKLSKVRCYCCHYGCPTTDIIRQLFWYDYSFNCNYNTN